MIIVNLQTNKQYSAPEDFDSFGEDHGVTVHWLDRLQRISKDSSRTYYTLIINGGGGMNLEEPYFKIIE